MHGSSPRRPCKKWVKTGGVAEPHTVSKILTAKNGWMGRQRKDEERDGGEDRLDDDADSGQQQRITSCHQGIVVNVTTTHGVTAHIQ